jgi:hypothetical protein
MRSVAIGGEMLGLAFGAMGHHMPDERAQLNSGEAGHLGAGERGDFIVATYREIAAHFSLGGPNAARTKVKRAGWSAEPSNHPADPLHIRVPRDAWYQAPDTAHPRRADRPHITENGETSQQFDMSDLKDAKRPYLASGGEAPYQPDAPHITALEGHIASLQADLAAERARADRAEQARAAADTRVDATMARADAADADRRAAEARAERAEQGRDAERARADALRDRLTTMQEQLADAHAALQAAESADARAKQAEADRERAEAGWDAERGRAGALRAQIDELNAEMVAARAEAAAHAEAGRAEERQRADAINALLEATQEELAGQRELTDQTRADAERAHAEAEALRQAEDERRARGRWARLRVAWRGE